MQVLIALMEAGGSIVRREELIERCWGGRIVGTDAINRVLYRLRQVSEGIGAGSFKLETITKIGYRLVPSDHPAGLPSQIADPIPAAGEIVSRRSWLVGGSVAGLIAIGGASILALRSLPAAQPKITPEVSMLLQRAHTAYREGGFESRAEAIGLYRKVVALQPELADAWGLLALSYASSTHSRAPDLVVDMTSHAKAAIARALVLDAKNPFALAAEAQLMLRIGHWLEQESLLLDAIRREPQSDILWQTLAVYVLGPVGRCADAIAAVDKADRLGPPSPLTALVRIQQLWAVHRLEEADRASDEAYALFPANSWIWFARFYLWLFTGRATAAIGLAEDRNARPAGVSENAFDLILNAAKAIAANDPVQIKKAVQGHLVSAHNGAGYAENAMQLASAVGDLDTAYAVAAAYYFGEGFETGELRFEVEGGTYLRLDDRRTFFLFLPPMTAFRADGRFNPLIERLGLAQYWQKSGKVPDFRRVERHLAT